ncbi:MAG: hypothetical protein QFB87_02000 [Patescibacteria group bacterium]|nr:hypothetical protein [Patescibacteria group bacterium]
MKKSLKAGILAALVIGTGAFALGNASALSLSGPTDCDDNAVIYCGAQSTDSLISKYTNGTSHNTAKSIHDIYSKFGISAAEVKAMNATAVAGSVTANGDVLVGNKVVAKNALTAGRQAIGNSTQVTYNGTTFYTRSPRVSFRSASIPAYVVLKDGVFQFAVIESCANPVTATPVTPPATPNYTIVKSVAIKGSTDFKDSIANLAPGTHVVYQINVASTGKTAVENLTVKDVLPAHVTYVAHTLHMGATEINSAPFFGTGYPVTSLAAGSSLSFTYEAVVGTADSGTPCTKETLTNTGTITATSLPTTSDTATVATVCSTVKIVNAPTCNNFEIAAGDNRTINVTKFDFTANDAKFVSAVINWDINKTNVSTAAITDSNAVVGQSHQYAADGTYVVGVTITFTLDGKTVTATGLQCEKQVAFTTQPPVVTPPTAPVALVNTGAGSTAAMFAGVSAVAAVGYYLNLRRRLSL